VIRILWVGWLFSMKTFAMSSWYLLLTVIQPVIFATIAFYMFRAGRQEETLFYAALGAGMMGVFSSMLFGSGGTITWWRWQGYLEPLVAAPAPFLLVLLPSTLASATTGMYSLVATLLWGRVAFGIPFDVAHPWLFALSLPATVVGLGMLGLLMAATFVFYRHANAIMNMLEYPIWLLSGVIFPLGLLPEWTRPVSWLLAPTWGIRAVRGAALGGDGIWEAIGMCLALGAVYLAIGALFVDLFLRFARERATLALT
jgi:ABC-2 type transport system permease protein